MNFSYRLNWDSVSGELRIDYFGSSMARQRFIEEHRHEIEFGDCYVDQLDGKGYVYQYSFHNRREE